MNKNETIEAFANIAAITKTDAKKYLDAIIEVFTTELVEGGEVNLTGFGKFSVVDKPARTGRNPLTKETIQIEAKRAPKFKFGKNVKDAVNCK